MSDTPKTPLPAPAPDYGVEVMCASWNPVVAVVVEPIDQAKAWLSEHSAADAETFLTQFYRFQQS